MFRRSALLVVTAMATVAALLVPPAVSAAGATQRQASSPSSDSTLKAAIADLQAYWTKEFPQLYGASYKPLSQIIAATSGTKIPNCGGQPNPFKKVQGNAFYCFGDNFIAYDAQTLFPALAKNFGPFATALVLAHEWGHAIQDRVGINRSNQPVIYVELQADCFAGSWVQRIANGQSKTVKFAPGDLDLALSAYLTFRDPPGNNEPDDPQAHGDGFDRVNAFQTGFDGGAPACKPFFDSPPPVTEQAFTSAQEAANGGNLPANQVLPGTIDVLNDFYSQVAPGVALLTERQLRAFDSSGPASKLPKCGSTRLSVKQVKDRVFYCLDDGYIGFDSPFLNSIYTNIGDFGAAVLVANAYATYVQYKQSFPGVSDNTVNAVLGADCYTGGWSAALENASLSGGAGLPAPSLNTSLSLSPGDLDKVIEAFIRYDAARGVSAKSDFVFRRIEAFRQGFFQGYNTCASTFANSSSTSTPSG